MKNEAQCAMDLLTIAVVVSRGNAWPNV